MTRGRLSSTDHCGAVSARPCSQEPEARTRINEILSGNILCKHLESGPMLILTNAMFKKEMKPGEVIITQVRAVRSRSQRPLQVQGEGCIAGGPVCALRLQWWHMRSDSRQR